VEGSLISTSTSASVTVADLVLVAVNEQYAALDRIEFDYRILTRLTNAHLEYTITDAEGRIVANGTPMFSTNGSIVYYAPENPSAGYICTLILTTPGGLITGASATVSIFDDYGLVLTVSSPHLSGEFRPGENLEIAYEILPRGHPNLPLYRLTTWTSWSDASYSILTSETQGTLHIQISGTASNGFAQIMFELFDGVAGNVLASGNSLITISANAGDWDTILDSMQNETDFLRDELAASQNNITLMNGNLSAMQAQLGMALKSLNTTLNELIAMQENLTSLDNDLENVKGQINDRPTSGTIAVWLIVAAVAFAAIAAVLMLLLRKR